MAVHEHAPDGSCVLYLRSFEDEALTSKAPVSSPFWPFVVKTGEQTLVEALQDAGPVIAIGRPGERLPELGARRFYFADAEWQDVASRWISEARLVVLRIGPSEGLWWEVQTSVALAHPRRLLLVVPDEQAAYDAFRARFDAAFGPACELPALKLAGSGRWTLAGFIRFDDGGRATWVPLRDSNARNLRRTLRPVFEGLARGSVLAQGA